jgi:hypothetical protein
LIPFLEEVVQQAILWRGKGDHALTRQEVEDLNSVILTLGSGLIDHIQKMTMAAMAIADMKVWAQRSYRV